MQANRNTLNALALTARQASEDIRFIRMEDIHAMAADLWGMYLKHRMAASPAGVTVTATDVAHMVGLLSVAEATIVPASTSSHMVTALMAGATAQYSGVNLELPPTQPKPESELKEREPAAQPPKHPDAAKPFLRKREGAAEGAADDYATTTPRDIEGAIKAIIGANNTKKL